eukprot:281176_1
MMTEYQLPLNFTFKSLPLYVIEITIGQFLLPFERRRIKRISKYYKDLFDTKSTISTLTNNPSSSISIINISTFWNILNYIQNHILHKYFLQTQNTLSLTHETFDKLSNNDYFMLKYLLIYYYDLKNHEATITSLAAENNTEIDWDKLFNLLPQINQLCLSLNENKNQKLTIFMNDIFAFCTNIKEASFLKKIWFSRAGIDDECIIKWCNTMMSRNEKDEYFCIESLDLSFNDHITDACMEVLFECIAYKCPKLEVLNISSTLISDKTCKIIYDFCQTCYNKKDEFNSSLWTINVMRCDKITKNGNNLLSAILMEKWCPRNFYIHRSIQLKTKLIGVNV